MNTVVDIAVGGGELLRAANKRWPASRLYGLDIDTTAIQLLKRAHRDWKLRTGDLMEPSSFRPPWPKADVLLLNPPFSCRGGIRIEVELDSAQYSVSRALACLIKGMAVLRSDGEIVALMPAGSLHSQKDVHAWAKLRESWAVTIVRECGRNTFQSFCPSTVLIHLCRQTNIYLQPQPIKVKSRHKVLLLRGKAQMHMVSSPDDGDAPVLHTTDLLSGRISKPRTRYKKGNGTIKGLCVLLPRVGNPDLRKLILHYLDEPTRLSDCLFAMCCPSVEETKELFHTLRAHWAELRRLYVGTGANFITLNRLAAFLQTLEYEASTVQNLSL